MNSFVEVIKEELTKLKKMLKQTGTDYIAVVTSVEGKTAYVGGKMVVGTMEVLDTTDATASSDRIIKGKTAYVNGELVVGTMEILEGKSYTPSRASRR